MRTHLLLCLLLPLAAAHASDTEVGGHVLEMTSNGRNPGDRPIQRMPERPERIRQVIYRDWAGEPRRMEVAEVKKLWSRRCRVPSDQGELELVTRSYLLLPDIPAEIPAEKLDSASATWLLWSHVETETILLHTVDGYLDGTHVTREATAGWPSISRTFGNASIVTRAGRRSGRLPGVD